MQASQPAYGPNPKPTRTASTPASPTSVEENGHVPLVAPSVRGFRPGVQVPNPPKGLGVLSISSALHLPLQSIRDPFAGSSHLQFETVCRVLCVLCLPLLTDSPVLLLSLFSPTTPPPPLPSRRSPIHSLPGPSKADLEVGAAAPALPCSIKTPEPRQSSLIPPKQAKSNRHPPQPAFPQTLSLHHQSASPAQPVAARLPGLAIAADLTPKPSRPSRSPRIYFPPTTRALGCALPALR